VACIFVLGGLQGTSGYTSLIGTKSTKLENRKGNGFKTPELLLGLHSFATAADTKHLLLENRR
jgi:hypothetical protein